MLAYTSPTLLLLPFLLSLLSSTAAAASFHLPTLSRRADTDNANPPAAKDYTSDALFRATVLNVTNTYRKQHNATSLAWNDTLADGARKWSERCKFEHSGGPDGENLSSGYPNASASIVAWGHERVDYNFKKGEFGHNTGHFTQLVWKSTTSVGCGRTECNGKTEGSAPGWFVVCTYHPPGNVLGAFTQNVQPELPADKQPADVPSDPAVPTSDAKPCPQGGVCSAGARLTIPLGAKLDAKLGGMVVLGVLGMALVWG